MNPFVYAQVVTANDFCNRKEEIKELCRDIFNCKNVIIFSPRRYGKTSLIQTVLGKLNDKDYIKVFMDLYPAVNKEKFIRIYAEAIARSLTGNIKKIINTIKVLIPTLIPKVIYKTGNDLPEFEFDFDKSKSYVPSLESLFESIHKQTISQKKKAVVIFDEFQEVLQYGDDEIERLMRSKFQHHKNVSYIFSGSKKHLIIDMFNNPNKPFYKSGKFMPISKIAANNLEDFICDKFKKAGYNVKKSIIQQIVNFAECHPYYTQMLCYIIFENTYSEKKIIEADIKQAIIDLLKKESSTYMAIMDGLSHRQKELLIAIAKEGEPSSILNKNFINKYNLGAASTIDKSAHALLNKSIIDKDNGNYIFADIFFREWLKSL